MFLDHVAPWLRRKPAAGGPKGIAVSSQPSSGRKCEENGSTTTCNALFCCYLDSSRYALKLWRAALWFYKKTVRDCCTTRTRGSSENQEQQNLYFYWESKAWNTISTNHLAIIL
jgi:hypothetical protein